MGNLGSERVAAKMAAVVLAQCGPRGRWTGIDGGGGADAG